jgi:hypothetical protein
MRNMNEAIGLKGVPVFVRLNLDWNAEANAPNPKVSVAATEVTLHFRLSNWMSGDGNAGTLTFHGSRAWRLGPTNDEGWFMGQCRYGRTAPAWGEFYELTGDDPQRDMPGDWQVVSQPESGDRHFLFYLRDETFECVAQDWKFEK